MGMMIVWLMLSHGLLIAIGFGLIRSDILWLGLVFAVLIPGFRLFRRFRPTGGYRLVGNIERFGSALSERGGRVLRTEEPLRFKLCFTAEVVVLVGVFVLFMLPSTV